MFILMSNYLKAPEAHGDVVQAHREWADKLIREEKVVLSGPQASGQGGIIVVALKERHQVDSLIAEDPFFTSGVAEYQVIEFKARAYDPRLWFLRNL